MDSFADDADLSDENYMNSDLEDTDSGMEEEDDPVPEYHQPLALINSSADLEGVLVVKSIGEAMNMLSPSLPGTLVQHAK